VKVFLADARLQLSFKRPGGRTATARLRFKVAACDETGAALRFRLAGLKQWFQRVSQPWKLWPPILHLADPSGLAMVFRSLNCAGWPAAGIENPADDSESRIDLPDPFLSQRPVHGMPAEKVGVPALDQSAVGKFCLSGVCIQVQPQNLKTLAYVGRDVCSHMKPREIHECPAGAGSPSPGMIATCVPGGRCCVGIGSLQECQYASRRGEVTSFGNPAQVYTPESRWILGQAGGVIVSESGRTRGKWLE